MQARLDTGGTVDFKKVGINFSSKCEKVIIRLNIKREENKCA